jgi:hypothetical protein
MSLTREDILHIGELLHPIHKKLEAIEAERVTKSHLEANNSILGTIIRAEIAGTNKRIDSVASAVKTGFHDLVTHAKKMEQKIDKLGYEERIKQLEERVRTLEEQLARLTHPTKH